MPADGNWFLPVVSLTAHPAGVWWPPTCEDGFMLPSNAETCDCLPACILLPHTPQQCRCGRAVHFMLCALSLTQMLIRLLRAMLVTAALPY